jgi:hypothetical protein
MSGGFEVDDSRGVLVQQTPEMPIGWYSLTGDTLPYTIIGAFDWRNITVAASVLLPKLPTSLSASSTAIGWIAARVSQTAEECDGPGVICSNPWGLFAVVDNIGQLRLHLRLAQLANADDPSCVFKTNVTIADNGWCVSLPVWHPSHCRIGSRVTFFGEVVLFCFYVLFGFVCCFLTRARPRARLSCQPNSIKPL